MGLGGISHQKGWTREPSIQLCYLVPSLPFLNSLYWTSERPRCESSLEPPSLGIDGVGGRRWWEGDVSRNLDGGACVPRRVFIYYIYRLINTSFHFF